MHDSWSRSWRVLIADDHAMMRDGLCAMLSKNDEFEVVGEVTNGLDAIRSVAILKPDVILMEFTMPHTNGIEATRRIKQRYPETKIIILTVRRTEEYIRAAFQAGADGYVLKDDNQTELLNALRDTLNGRSYLSPKVCAKVVDGFLGGLANPKDNCSWDTLTNRQREILKLVAEGYRNKDIAGYLSISIKTVEKHRSNLMKRLSLHNTSAVTAYAIENGFVN